MSTPGAIDIRSRITHVRTETERRRSLSAIQYQVAHYQAGSFVSPNMTEEQDIAYLLGLAHYHQTAHDFGGGVLGRTLEYTYAIMPSGRLFLVNDETLVTWSHRDGNYVGMSTLFCIGSGQAPTQAMLDTGLRHFTFTIGRTDMQVTRARTVGHGETPLMYGRGPDWGNNTDCPGEMLPWVREFSAGSDPTPDPQPVPDPEVSRYFPETGHSIGHGFLDYWKANGGLATFGYPLTEEMQETIGDWTGTAQYFERARFEYHTEHTPPDVEMGLVGAELLAAKSGLLVAATACKEQ